VLSPTHHLSSSIRPRIVRRLLSAVCLATIGAAAASAQTFTFTSCTGQKAVMTVNGSVTAGPAVVVDGISSYGWLFEGTFSLTANGSTQTTTGTGVVGTTFGDFGEGQETVYLIRSSVSADSASQWGAEITGVGTLLTPGVFPTTLPPISAWTLPFLGSKSMSADYIGLTTALTSTYFLCSITNGGSTGSGSSPTISLSSPQLQFAYTEGGTPPAPQTVTISNANGGSLTWTAVNVAPWITLTDTSTSVTVSIDPSGLPPNVYIANIVITSPGATNTPLLLKVTLTVTANAPPVFSGPMNFAAITPCRVADTRNANGPFGGPSIAGQTSRDFVIPNSACGIPATAGAYSLNVAVVPKNTLGYVTVWPAGQSQPTVATLTSLDGQVRSNAAIVAAGANGAISVFATDDTDVILDINGYFNSSEAAADTAGRNTHGYSAAASTSGASSFYPLTPCRIADTRKAAGPLGGPSLAAQSTRAFPIANSSCGVPADALAYSLNFAAVPNGPLGFLTAWPTGQPQPLVASLNAVTGTVTANAVIVPAGENGAVDVYATNDTDLVIDIDGYFAAPGTGGLSFYAATPCRVLDSRNPQGTPPFNGERGVDVTASPCGLPATAQAFVFNATVVPPGPFGYLTMWPEGEPQPLAATLNALDGAITSNMAIVPTTTGSISVFGSNPTYLILDNFGYFAP